MSSADTTPLPCAEQRSLAVGCGPAARRKTRAMNIAWGSNVVTVGGDAPVVVQSMTNTDTADAIATAIQVQGLAQAGSELVRITVNSLKPPVKSPRFVSSWIE